jgi:hypothetical protein
MDLGLPADLTWYTLARDQGGVIAGLVALIAAAIAYIGALRGARLQVAAMRSQMKEARKIADEQIAAADRQTSVAREQLDQATRAAAERERTERRALIYALAIESARVHRLARDRLEVAQREFGARPGDVIRREVAPFLIDSGEVLRSAGVLALRYEEVSGAATNLHSMVDIVNSALTSAGAIGLLEGQALFGHLKNVIGAAETLARKLEAVEKAEPK